MKIENTKITTAGVFRCCIASIGTEFEDGVEIKIGEKSSCPHCKTPFTLIKTTDDKKPVWVPDWQIK